MISLLEQVKELLEAEEISCNKKYEKYGVEMNLISNIVLFILIFQQNIAKFFQNAGLNSVSKIVDSFDELFLVVLCWLFLLNVFKNRKINKFTIKWSILMFIFIISGWISYFYFSEGKLSIALVQSILSSRFFLVVLFSVNIKNFNILSSNLSRLIVVVATINIFVVALSLISPTVYLSLFPNAIIDSSRVIFNRGASSGIFVHPTYSGFFSLIALIIVYCSKSENNKFFIKNIHLVMLLLTVVLSFKAKSIIELMVVIFSFTLLNYSKSKLLKLLKVSIPLILLSIATSSIWISQFNIYNFIGNTDSNLGGARNALHLNALKLAQDYFPFGVGFSKYGTISAYRYYSEYYYKFGMNNIWGLDHEFGDYATDVYWPGVLGETGWIGTLTVIGSFYVLIKTFLKRIKLGERNKYIRDTNSTVIIALLILLVALIESTGSPVFTSNPMGTVVGLFVAAGIRTIFNQNSKINVENR